MIKFRKPMYSKGPDDCVILIPTLIYQKLDWRKIFDTTSGLDCCDISYSLHFKWFKMQLSFGINYKKRNE